MTSAAETLYPNQGSTTAPIREDYRQAAPTPAPAATPASSSAAAPAPDPAAPAAKTSPAEPRSAFSIVYGDAGAKLGNRLATEGIRRDDVGTADAVATSAVTPNAEPKAADSAKPEGEKAAEGTAEPKAEPEIDMSLPQAFLDMRPGEPAATSPDDFNAVMHPSGPFERGADFDTARAAFHAAELGQTQAAYLMHEIKNFARNGPNPNHTPENTIATLEAWFPGKSAEHVANARAMIDRMETKWPNIRAELNATGLGNHPGIIRALSQIYSRRPRR